MCNFSLLIHLFTNADGLIQETSKAQSQTKSRHGLSPFHTHTLNFIYHTSRNTTKSFMKILTDKKVVLSHRCLLSFPKGVLPPSYLPQSPYLCGPRLQRPTVNKQRIRSSRGMRHSRGYNTLKETEQVGSPPVRALLCLCYTKFKGCVVRPILTSLPKGFSAFRT